MIELGMEREGGGARSHTIPNISTNMFIREKSVLLRNDTNEETLFLNPETFHQLHGTRILLEL